MPPNGASPLYLATNAPQTGPLLQRDFPQFEQVVRLMENTPVMALPDSADSYYETGVYFADSNVFSVFEIPLLQGNPDELFSGPFQIVLNETLARKYFGSVNAVGKTLMLNSQAPVRVTGVMGDLSDNTHLDARAFVPMATAEAILHRHVGEDAPSFTDFEIIPLRDIRLNSQRDNEMQANGSTITVLTFSAIAVFILLIACCNFMNLSTVRSLARAREIGMRKVCGASRTQIALQFLTEFVVIALLAVVLAAVFVQLLLPWFNSVLSKSLTIGYLEVTWAIPSLVGLAVVVGILSGSYPALYLSSFPCVTILKGQLTKGSAGVLLRKTLVVLQFAISIALVIASGIALSQLRYAQELLRHPGIVSVTAANLMPGNPNTNADGIRYEGGGLEGTGMGFLTRARY